MTAACHIKVQGVVQGVGFRPFVFQLARANTLTGWVLNDNEGVEIHVEGPEPAVDAFVESLRRRPPDAACVRSIDVHAARPEGVSEFTIRDSRNESRPTVQISADLPVCDACLAELFDPEARRYQYPYINCTNCGPRYSVVLGVPYDRANTTMHHWPLDRFCEEQYLDPADRRFHAQPVACPACGPHYSLIVGNDTVQGDDASIRNTAELLSEGSIVALKGLGGYHLACDASNAETVRALRERKYRKEKPFALMVRSVEEARAIVELSPEAELLLRSAARPIVLAPAKKYLAGVSPDNDDLGVMLPYTPLHHLLFAAGAPGILVMTSANRSNEPIAYEDDDALRSLAGIADAFLVGERPIARRLDDSVVRAGAFGTSIIRRSRGYAPSSVATIPMSRPVLALGADLKNSITLVVNGQAFVSQHIGDLDQYASFVSFKETVEDLISMYEVGSDLVIAYDAHPQYRSAAYGHELLCAERYPIQHHRAHVASVLAEHGAWSKRVLGIAFDGTGYGDDGTIWGGEFFIGSIQQGFERVSHLRPAVLPGGDGAARNPVQSAAGFLSQIGDLPALDLPPRYQISAELVRKRIRTFETTSVGRLFDAATAVLGFTRESTFEGQAAIWLEQLARRHQAEPYPFPIDGQQLDFRPLLRQLAIDRYRGRDVGACARAFQAGIAHGLCRAASALCDQYSVDTIVLSGGVFQNEMLCHDVKNLLSAGRLAIWTNRSVPANDGGISLGQAALAAFQDKQAHDA